MLSAVFGTEMDYLAQGWPLNCLCGTTPKQTWRILSDNPDGQGARVQSRRRGAALTAGGSLVTTDKDSAQSR
jgi:hypothetical protein